MASQLARKKTRYYVGRREINGTEEAVYHFTEYNRTFVAEENFARTDGFADTKNANIVAARLNQIEETTSSDLEVPKRFHYFTYKKDDQVMTLGNYNLAEEEAEETTPDEDVNDNPEGTEEGA